MISRQSVNSTENILNFNNVILNPLDTHPNIPLTTVPLNPDTEEFRNSVITQDQKFIKQYYDKNTLTTRILDDITENLKDQIIDLDPDVKLQYQNQYFMFSTSKFTKNMNFHERISHLKELASKAKTTIDDEIFKSSQLKQTETTALINLKFEMKSVELKAMYGGLLLTSQLNELVVLGEHNSKMAKLPPSYTATQSSSSLTSNIKSLKITLNEMKKQDGKGTGRVGITKTGSFEQDWTVMKKLVEATCPARLDKDKAETNLKSGLKSGKIGKSGARLGDNLGQNYGKQNIGGTFRSRTESKIEPKTPAFDLKFTTKSWENSENSGKTKLDIRGGFLKIDIPQNAQDMYNLIRQTAKHGKEDIDEIHKALPKSYFQQTQSNLSQTQSQTQYLNSQNFIPEFDENDSNLNIPNSLDPNAPNFAPDGVTATPEPTRTHLSSFNQKSFGTRQQSGNESTALENPSGAPSSINSASEQAITEQPKKPLQIDFDFDFKGLDITSGVIPSLNSTYCTGAITVKGKFGEKFSFHGMLKEHYFKFSEEMQFDQMPNASRIKVHPAEIRLPKFETVCEKKFTGGENRRKSTRFGDGPLAGSTGIYSECEEIEEYYFVQLDIEKFEQILEATIINQIAFLYESFTSELQNLVEKLKSEENMSNKFMQNSVNLTPMPDSQKYNLLNTRNFENSQNNQNIQGVFPKVSYFWGKHGRFGLFLGKKRVFKSFFGQNMLF